MYQPSDVLLFLLVPGCLVISLLGFAIYFICPPEGVGAENLVIISTIALVFSVFGYAVYFS